MTWQAWLSWVGIVIAIIGFFVAPIYFGVVTLILGAVSLTGPEKSWAWISVCVGVLVFFTGIW